MPFNIFLKLKRIVTIGSPICAINEYTHPPYTAYRSFHDYSPILKNLSISLCLSCITTSLFASPAKLSSVKELMQMSQIDYLLKESINELTPYYDQQAEQIISNITGIKTLGPKEKEAAKKLGLL